MHNHASKFGHSLILRLVMQKPLQTPKIFSRQLFYGFIQMCYCFQPSAELNDECIFSFFSIFGHFWCKRLLYGLLKQVFQSAFSWLHPVALLSQPSLKLSDDCVFLYFCYGCKKRLLGFPKHSIVSYFMVSSSWVTIFNRLLS